MPALCAADVVLVGLGSPVAAPPLRVQDVLRAHWPEYQRRPHTLCWTQHKVLSLVTACRTAELGYHQWQCDHCGATRTDYDSCRDRHCPTCGGASRAQWLANLQPLLPPVPHFQLVFTLPAELRPLALGNPAAVYGLLFRAAGRSLVEMGERQLGARLGAVLMLHTWNQRLDLHPHVHAIVPAGGLSLDGTRWVSCLGPLKKKRGRPRRPFLLPVRALGELHRGKFLAELNRLWEAGELKLAGDTASLADPEHWRAFLAKLHGLSWNVFAQPPASAEQGPESLVKYLARYVAGAAISDGRLISHEHGCVTFWARDPAAKGEARKERHPFTLSGEEFVRRFALHILPPGFARVRYYGLLSPAARGALARCRELLPAADSLKPPPAATLPELDDWRRCPSCQQGTLQPSVSRRGPAWRNLVRHWRTRRATPTPRATSPSLFPCAEDSS